MNKVKNNYFTLSKRLKALILGKSRNKYVYRLYKYDIPFTRISDKR